MSLPSSIFPPSVKISFQEKSRFLPTTIIARVRFPHGNPILSSLTSGDEIEFAGKLTKGPRKIPPLPGQLQNGYVFYPFQIEEAVVLTVKEHAKLGNLFPIGVFFMFLFWTSLPFFWILLEDFRNYVFSFEYLLFIAPGFLASNFTRRMIVPFFPDIS